MRARSWLGAAPRGSGRRPGDDTPLTRAEFMERLRPASNALWCVAVAVMGGRSEADDVLQDAIAIGLERLSSFTPGTNFTAWMSEIVRNVARNQVRKNARRRTSPVDPVAIDASRRAPEQGMRTAISPEGRVRADQPDFDDAVVAALLTLDETPRECLLLRTLLGLSHAEIARILAIPEGTAMSHFSRARRRMREILSGGAGSPGGDLA